MKTLELNQMEKFNGGDGCENAVLSAALGAFGLLFSAVTLNPVGMTLGVIGFIGGMDGYMENC